MELTHEPVVEGSEIFQTTRACVLQAPEKQDLCPRIELLQELAQLSHGITAGGNAEEIMDQSLDELLSDIFGIEVAIWEFAGSEKLIKWDGLCSKGN
jgi:hypothetical protein